MCCHPSLSPASQIALTLRAVGGLTTSEIARAFLVPEATMTRRISRAKQRIKDSGIPFGMPLASERTERLGAVLHVLYLIFNEGYATTSGPSLQRTELSAAATDWPQIMALYELLLRIADNPVVLLNHAVAVAMVRGPHVGLELLDELNADDRITGDHRLHAVRGHLLEMAGERAAARDSYLAAARQTTSLPQQRYLHAQAARLADDE